MGGAIGRGLALVLVIDQDQFLADLGVRQADAAGKARLGCGGDTYGEMRGQFLVAQGKQRREVIRGEGGDL